MNQTVYEKVSIGKNSVIGENTILGEPPRGFRSGELPMTIGENATIRSHTVIYAGNSIGKHFQTGHHVMIREKNSIGDGVSIGTGTIVEHHVIIESEVRIHSQAFIPEYCHLEKGCWLGPNVVLTNAKYPNRPETKNNLNGVRIGAGAVIGANSTILPGVTIGRGAVVGAGSVVVRDVPPNTVIYGNPAKIQGSASELTY